jgi:hypothetical protein
MKRLLPLFLLFSFTFSWTGCEQLVKKLTSKNIEGTYEDENGTTAEFTASKVIMTGSSNGKKKKKKGDMSMTLTFDYKVEGKHVFLETKSNVGGLGSLLMAMGDASFEIIDDNTLKYTATGFGTMTRIYKRVSQ